MISYIHGSEDSLDVDVYYVFDEIPPFDKCRKFCSEDPNENRNIITIKNGMVSDCFIGVVDEINNGLIDTYDLHKQKYPLLITKRMERDKNIKFIRAVRGIISILSKTHYRTEIKQALKTGWTNRINVLRKIDFTNIDYNNLGKGMNGIDLKKVIAFQLGQSLGLIEGKEFYTKSSIAKQYPDLKPFLYRQKGDDSVLNAFSSVFADYLEEIKVKDLPENKVLFIDENRIIDLKNEKEINIDITKER